MRTNHTYRIDCVPFENFHRVILFHLCDLNSSAHDIFWSNNQYLSIIALKDRTFIFFIFPSPSVHKFTLMAFYNVIRSSVLWLKKIAMQTPNYARTFTILLYFVLKEYLLSALFARIKTGWTQQNGMRMSKSIELWISIKIFKVHHSSMEEKIKQEEQRYRHKPC